MCVSKCNQDRALHTGGRMYLCNVWGKDKGKQGDIFFWIR